MTVQRNQILPCLSDRNAKMAGISHVYTPSCRVVGEKWKKVVWRSSLTARILPSQSDLFYLWFWLWRDRYIATCLLWAWDSIEPFLRLALHTPKLHLPRALSGQPGNYLGICDLACPNPMLILLHRFSFLPDEFDLSRCWHDKTQVPQWRMLVHNTSLFRALMNFGFHKSLSNCSCRNMSCIKMKILQTVSLLATT